MHHEYLVLLYKTKFKSMFTLNSFFIFESKRSPATASMFKKFRRSEIVYITWKN